MELKIDLVKKEEKSVLLMILGLLLFFFPIFILLWRHFIPYAHNVPVLDNIAYLLLFISGIGLITIGSGGSVLRIFGKAFIIIDNEKISIKTSYNSKVQIVFWNDIKSIQYDSGKYNILTINDTRQIIDFSSLDYSLIEEVKRTVIGIAKEKGNEIDQLV